VKNIGDICNRNFEAVNDSTHPVALQLVWSEGKKAFGQLRFADVVCRKYIWL